MQIQRARLYSLSIPFKMGFSHSEASRWLCDSYILEVNDGERSGYGELVLREYVNDRGKILDSEEKIAARIEAILLKLTEETGRQPDLSELRSALLQPQWERHELPLLAAVEAAFLDLSCRQRGVDVYTLLEREPLRNELRYGGIIPILPTTALEKMLDAYRQLKIPYIRIKLSRDLDYNRQVLETARRRMGESFDLRVDVNCAWDIDAAEKQLQALESYGIDLVEEPIGPDRGQMKELADRTREKGFTFVADESAVTPEDIDAILEDGSFGMLNLRVAKNGGIFRTLSLAEKAEQAGLSYQLGCHVGETGILSAIGRISASLMPNPRYIDGSFDEYLLSYNITTESLTFGQEGRAPVIRGGGMGYELAVERLGRGRSLL